MMKWLNEDTSLSENAKQLIESAKTEANTTDKTISKGRYKALLEIIKEQAATLEGLAQRV